MHRFSQIYPSPLSRNFPTSLHGRWIRMPSFPCLKNELLHSSYARPAPNPRPTHAGQALRLKTSTEKTTPKPTPIEDRIRREERQ